ncbi:hypothetical protein L484_021430 [Morus notabilis]|uniref:Uncharacterized protein n=1 Tax=Morus notabilis TaxID=981085 RepID=W9S067_9ROSA|nr:hypothetical protein L484_021430 [Morus notabilis]
MRNEDIAELMKAMEESFKQHSGDQLAKFSSLLEQHMASTDQRLFQLQRLFHLPQPQQSPGPTLEVTAGQSGAKADNSPNKRHRLDVDIQQPDMNSHLRTLRLDVPRFDFLLELRKENQDNSELTKLRQQLETEALNAD